jgi:hypothetical protein
MHPALQHYALPLSVLRDLLAAVRASVVGNGDIDGDPYALRPEWATRKIATAFKTGLKMVAVFLRRLLLLLALELETGLEPKPGVARIRQRRKAGKPGRLAFVVLDETVKKEFDESLRAFGAPLSEGKLDKGFIPRGKPFPMKRLYRQLDLLAGIIADPLPRARRLAWWLARNRPGPIIAPDRHYHPPCPCRRHWTLEPSLTFDLMAGDIIRRSWQRPPPLEPRPRAGPRVRML